MSGCRFGMGLPGCSSCPRSSLYGSIYLMSYSVPSQPLDGPSNYLPLLWGEDHAHRAPGPGKQGLSRSSYSLEWGKEGGRGNIVAFLSAESQQNASNSQMSTKPPMSTYVSLQINSQFIKTLRVICLVCGGSTRTGSSFLWEKQQRQGRAGGTLSPVIRNW